jgi:hypothetical protein
MARSTISLALAQSPFPRLCAGRQRPAWVRGGPDGWRCLSLSWRAPMREPEPEKVPIGIPLPDLTMDQFMDLEDGWSRLEDRV